MTNLALIRTPTRLKLAVEAFFRKHLLKPEVAHLDAWVVSPGGVGTTFLMEYISEFSKINHPYDDDGLKHWPRMPSEIQSGDGPKVLFIVGDTEAIVESIARRNWLQTQATKIGGVWAALAPKSMQKEAFGKAVEAQIASWTEASSGQVLVVDYDDIWARKVDIGAHLALDEASFCERFPARKDRTKNSPQPDAETQNALQT